MRRLDDEGAVAVLVAILFGGGVLLGMGALVAQDLPDTLQMVVSSLRAGFTLQHGIEAAVRDSTGPVAAELRRALSETRIGGELEESLVRVGTRTGNADMQWLTMAILFCLFPAIFVVILGPGVLRLLAALAR